MPPLLPTGYNVSLVCLSVAIAILASYTALDLAGRVSATQGRSQLTWLLCGAITMGAGIWSMHFIGMLAFRMPAYVHYRFDRVLLSVLPAIAASGLALYIVSRAALGWINLVGGSLLMGSGIAAMHYAGMSAMSVNVAMHYAPKLVGVSIGIAIAVSFVALSILFKLREESVPNRTVKKILAALLMGMAVPIMHYTGMAAVSFTPTEKTFPDAVTSSVLQAPANATPLASTIIVGTLIIFAVAWLSAFLDRKLAAQISYSEELQTSKTKLKQQTQTLSQTLSEVKSLQAQLIQSEKMSSIGQLVAGIAHEINNPVSFIHGNLEHVEAYTQDLLSLVNLYQRHYPQPAPDLEQALEDIDLDFLKKDLSKISVSMRSGTDRIRDIVLSLRNFSRMDEADLKSVDVHEGIESTLMILQHRLKGKGQASAIEVIRDYDELPLVDCYPSQLNQVFMNVLVNAVDAIEETKHKDRVGQVTIRTARIGTDWVEVAIADNGPGIPDSIKAQIFDPFFTTKPVGKGTGLGMSSSYQIVVERHRGKLTVFSDDGQGTEFSIQIPVTQKAVT